MSSVASASQSRSASHSNSARPTHDNENNGTRESFLEGGRPTRPALTSTATPAAAVTLSPFSSSREQVTPSSRGEEETDISPEQEEPASPIPLASVYRRCPYHDAILQTFGPNWQQTVPQQQQQQSMADIDEDDVIMARYMTRHNHPGEQYALFRRPDNGQLSTFRTCTCYASGIVMTDFDDVNTNVPDDQGVHECNGDAGGLGERHYQLDDLDLDLDLDRDGEVNSFLVGL